MHTVHAHRIFPNHLNLLVSYKIVPVCQSNFHNQPMPSVPSVASLPTSAAPSIRSTTSPHQPTPSQSKPKCNPSTSTSCNDGSGESCVHKTSCPKFQADTEAWKELTKGTKEYQDALETLKSQVCNKDCEYVCCKESTPIWSKWPRKFWKWTIQKLTIPQSSAIYCSVQLELKVLVTIDNQKLLKNFPAKLKLKSRDDKHNSEWMFWE